MRAVTEREENAESERVCHCYEKNLQRESTKDMKSSHDTTKPGEKATSPKNVQKMSYEGNGFVVSWSYALACHRFPSGSNTNAGHQGGKQLRNVAVHVALLTLHVVLLDKSVDKKCQSSFSTKFALRKNHSPINVLLDILDVQHASAPRRLDDLCNQL